MTSTNQQQQSTKITNLNDLYNYIGNKPGAKEFKAIIESEKWEYELDDIREDVNLPDIDSNLKDVIAANIFAMLQSLFNNCNCNCNCNNEAIQTLPVMQDIPPRAACNGKCCKEVVAKFIDCCLKPTPTDTSIPCTSIIDRLNKFTQSICKQPKKTLHEEIDAFYERKKTNTSERINWDNLTAKKWRIKTKSKYKLMKQNGMKLTDPEIESLILFCDYNIFCDQMRKSHYLKDKNSCHWKTLFCYLWSAVYKIYCVFHYQNDNFYSEYVEDEKKEQLLFRGDCGITFDESKSKLYDYTVTSFSDCFNIAKEFVRPKGMISIIPNAFDMIYLGILPAADVSWISRYPLECEWAVLGVEFQSVNKIQNNNQRYLKYIQQINTNQITLYEAIISTFYVNLNVVVQRISVCVRNMVETQLSNKIVRLFKEIIHEEQFDNMDGVKDDLETIIDSVILDRISNKINIDLNQKKWQLIERKIQEIVLNKVISHINEVIEDIQVQIMKNFKPNIAQYLANAFYNKMNEIGYEQLDDIREDVQDIKESTILSCVNFADLYLMEEKLNINEIVLTVQQIILRTVKLKERVLNPNSYNNIKSLIMNVTLSDIHEAGEFLTKWCKKIYTHLEGVHKTLNVSDLYSKESLIDEFKQKYARQSTNVESKSLSITKAIDFLNKKNVMVWLFNLYLKKRFKMFQEGKLTPSESYSVSKWWTLSNFGKYMNKKNPIMSTHIQAGIVDFTKRLLTVLNQNYYMFPKICDQLSDFIEYTLAFDAVADNIRMAANGAKPVQIDYWIIPQMTISRTTKNSEPYDKNELDNRTTHTKTSHVDGSKNPELQYLKIGRIERILTDFKLGYTKNKDFFFREIKSVDSQTIQKEIERMLQQYGGLSNSRNRFVFIIDRRNANNI
eukprot:39993_1